MENDLQEQNKQSKISPSSSPTFKKKSVKVKNFFSNSINNIVTGVKKSLNKSTSIKDDQSCNNTDFTGSETNEDSLKIRRLCSKNLLDVDEKNVSSILVTLQKSHYFQSKKSTVYL